jgi:hypothetical protein
MKSAQIVSKLVFYLLIPYKKIPKMPKLTKKDDGKWWTSQIGLQYYNAQPKFLVLRPYL